MPSPSARSMLAPRVISRSAMSRKPPLAAVVSALAPAMSLE
jgi:hypothetical protein